MSVSAEDVEELARGVAFFLQKEGGFSSVSSDYLLVLISRALFSLGNRGAARQFVDVVGEELRLPSSIRALLACGAVVPGSWFLFSSRLTRPAAWQAVGDRTVWVLDLNRITFEPEGCLEMAFFQGIAMVVDQIAGIWDTSAGKGVLGLRNVKPRIAALFGAGRGGRNVAKLSGEVRALCEGKLQSLRARRRWTCRPSVLLLDV
ncbi:MAG: hypothetical protein JXR37_36120 [Kiritimatiellae bacterium]|nr:hypothetical protein [Kiritimatiellia bacterium]